MAPLRLTVLICTHNRSALLQRVLASLNDAKRPGDASVEILVVANACSDGTAGVLKRYEQDCVSLGLLPVRWTEEPQPGKSHALNRGLELVEGGVVAFVDDDHRVHPEYLVRVAEAAREYPGAGLLCGRILPDWDGREPEWVHDSGPYRIYPLPIPRYDEGDQPREIGLSGPAPGGGNLCVRREVFERVGGFSTKLGPHGHDLGGGEDSDFVHRCLTAGERIQYVPGIVQFHFVDAERLRFGYLLRKSFERTRSGVRVRASERRRVPAFVLRKIATYLVLGLFSLSWPRTRFYLMRLAAALGELRGFMQREGESPVAGRGGPRRSAWTGGVAAGLLAAAFVLISRSDEGALALAAALSVSLAFTFALLTKSFYDFTQTGPPLKREILRKYRSYSTLALLRLAFWAFALCLGMAWGGAASYLAVALLVGWHVSPVEAGASGVLGVVLLTALQFCKHLLFVPGSIAASYHYRISRLYPLWHRLTPAGVRITTIGFAVSAVILFGSCALHLALLGTAGSALGFALLALAIPLGAFAVAAKEPSPIVGPRAAHPNIVMIGSDTLRADRLGAAKYRRPVTPFIDSLAARGTQFTSCYVPCARTAPSVISMLTGVWPHRHGVRDNFIGDDETRINVPALASLLASHGYSTAAVSDWSGGDLGKFNLGFQTLDLPRDQWNIKYLIRQGPKDLRLFLSLFTHNRFGKHVLPELYYLAGIPLTSKVGRDARTLISDFAAAGSPFFLNVFVSTTHPPFGSEYPYYTLWSDRSYSGESKFVMARLTDPWDIIRRQGDSRKDFDLEQIIDLYDGCVRNFDDEVRHIVGHLEACGLRDNTIIVIYSDHGMEFFEHDTWGQGNSVRGDFSARIPLVIVDPCREAGGDCRHVVRSIDIAPTLLACAGFPVPRTMQGVSLIPYLNGSRDDLGLRAFNETGIWLTEVPGMPANHLRYPDLLELLEVPDEASGTLSIKPEFRQIVIEAKDRMVCQGPWKLIYLPMTDGPVYRLFNLEADPECRNDVAAQYCEVVQQLKLELEAWMSGQAPVRPVSAAFA